MAEKKFFILLIVLALLYLSYLTPNLSLDGDNARYIILSKSLLAEKGLNFINQPGSPAAHPFTPGYPLLLIPFLLIGKGSVIILKISSLLFLLLSLWLIKKQFSDVPYPSFYLFLLALNPYLISFSHQVMSELPYMFFSLLSLRLSEEDSDSRASLWLVATLIFSIAIRQIGFALFMAVLVFAVWKKKKNLVIPILASCVFIFYLLWRDFFSSSSYLSQVFYLPYQEGLRIDLTGLITRISKNLFAYVTGFQSHKLLKLAMAGFSFVALVGWMINLRLKHVLVSVYFAFYLSFLLIWPWQGIRFLVPVIPLILYFFFCGWKKLLEVSSRAAVSFLSSIFPRLRHIATSSRWKICPWFIMLIPFLLLSLLMDVREMKQTRFNPYPPEWENYRQVAVWSGRNLSPGSLVVCRKPFLFYLWSGERVKTIVYPFTTDEEAWKDFFSKFSPLYIVADKFGGTTEAYLKSILLRYNNRLTPLYSTAFPEVQIFSMDKSRRK